MLKRKCVPALVGLCVLIGVGGCFGGGGGGPTLYIMDNGASGNTVYAWRIRGNGTISQIGGFATGANGTGIVEVPGSGPNDGIDPLGSQGSLTLSADNRYLYACNAGSGSITVFRVAGNGSLFLVETQATGGNYPVSVASNGSIVYVVDVNDPVGGSPSTLTGFTIAGDGSLTPIPNSTRQLSTPLARPSQVSFSPDGAKVIVTERTSDTISTFAVLPDGTLDVPVVTPSAGPAPFGFAFAGTSTMVVSDAAPGDPLGASASSYTLNGNGTLSTITGRVLNNQLASCWTTVSPDRTKAYVSNTGSDTITVYDIGGGGALTVQTAAVATGGAGSAPIDAGITSNGRLFVQLLGGTGAVAVYSVNVNGDLNLAGVRATGLPALGTQGVAVR